MYAVSAPRSGRETGGAVVRGNWVGVRGLEG